MTRSLAQVQADLAQALERVSDLERERTAARAQRRTDMIADFDGGMARSDIAAKWSVRYAYVTTVLAAAKPPRSEKTRRSRGLSEAQSRHYQIAIRAGVSPPKARQIAQAVTQ